MANCFDPIGANRLDVEETLTRVEAYELLCKIKAGELEVVYFYVYDQNEFKQYEGFKCHKCGCVFVKMLFSLQLRSADENAFRYFECRDCSKISYQDE